jgi:hypothetical protein
MHTTFGRVYRAQRYAGDRREARPLGRRTVGAMVTFALSMLVGLLAVAAQPPAKIPRIGMFAQFIAICRRSKWSTHLTNSPLLAFRAIVGSSAARKISSACSQAFC